MPASRIGTALLGTVVALAVACASMPAPQRAPQTEADQAATNAVYAALNSEPNYFFRHVDVQVDDGVAALSGYVWSGDAIYRARQIAGTVPGVRRVVTSGLELEREGRQNGVAR